MAGLNKIQIIGNLGNDPEMRFTPQGQAVTSFRVAVNRKWNDRDGGTREETIWFRVSAWERLAEICNQYLSKGRQVYIEGRMRPPQVFTDRNGEARSSLEIRATEMVMLGSGRGDSSGYQPEGDGREERSSAPPRGESAPRSEPTAPAGRNQPQRIDEGQMDDDEIPF